MLAVATESYQSNLHKRRQHLRRLFGPKMVYWKRLVATVNVCPGGTSTSAPRIFRIFFATGACKITCPCSCPILRMCCVESTTACSGYLVYVEGELRFVLPARPDWGPLTLIHFLGGSKRSPQNSSPPCMTSAACGKMGVIILASNSSSKGVMYLSPSG